MSTPDPNLSLETNIDKESNHIPQPTRGFCQLGLIHIPFTGTKEEIHEYFESSDGEAPNMTTANYRDSRRSKNIKKLGSSSTASLIANPNPGATNQTYVYGYPVPGEVDPRSDLVRCVDDASVYSPQQESSESGDAFGDGENSPAVSSDDAALLGAPPFMPRHTGEQPAFADLEALVGYNIWEDVNLSDEDATYVEHGDPLYSGDYEGPVVSQNHSSVGEAGISINAPNSSITLRRIFPNSKDIFYEEGAKIYYPPRKGADGVTEGRFVDILSTGGPNCGFRLHFSLSEPTGMSNANLADTESRIAVQWGDFKTEINRNNKYISRFYLDISSSDVKFWYYSPITMSWESSTLSSKPDLSSGEVEVYVHFVGPYMQVGFSPDVNDWTVLGPIEDPDNVGSVYQPYISADAHTQVTVTNLSAEFTYGAVAFNSVDPSSKTGAAFIPVGLNVSESRSHFIDAPANDDYLQSQRYPQNRNDTRTIDDYDEKPLYYCDWRNADNPQITYVQESVLDQRGQGSVTDFESERLGVQNSYDNGYMVNGRLDFNSTIEGPAFRAFKIDLPRGQRYDRRNYQPSNSMIRTAPWSDISDYLVNWGASYRSETPSGGIVSGEASVVLKNLANDERGKKILALLEENVFAISLGSGEKKSSIFFDGVITEVSTQYDSNGSTTTIRATDAMSHLLKTILFPTLATFGGMRYIDIVKHALVLGGLYEFSDIEEVDPGIYGDEEDRVLARQYYGDPNDPFRSHSALYKRLGYLLVNSSSLRNTFYADISTPIYKVIEGVISMMVVKRNPNTAVIYWEPGAIYNNQIYTKPIKFRRRLSPEYRDELVFLGKREPDGTAYNPASFKDGWHGVLTQDGYTQTTRTNDFYSSVILLGRDEYGTPINHKEQYANMFGGNALEKFGIDPEGGPGSTEVPDVRDGSYIGYRKTFYQSSESSLIHDRRALREQIEKYRETFAEPFQEINFECYVRRPLSHWGTFRVQSFVDDIEQGATDYYRYRDVSYSWSKDVNLVTARITGEYKYNFGEGQQA